MADTTITALTNATAPLSGTERVPMDQSGVTVDASTLQIAQTLPDATTSVAGKMSAADKTKLNAIESGATANSSDATLLARANHTGTQAAGTITGLATVATSGAYADLSGRPTLGGAAALNVGTSAGTVAAGDDARLSDARTPTAHNQDWSTITTGRPTTLSGYGITDAQPLDADLTSIAALTTTEFGRSHLTLTDAAAGTAALNTFSTTLKGLVPAPGTATGKVLSDSGSWVALGGGGDALVANPLSQFAATTSAQLRGVISDETGTDALVFSNSPTLVTPALGTPSALTLTNATGLPIATGLSGLGTGIATALAVNAGSAGAPVLFGGAGGTPSSLTLTNATGLPTSGITAFNADTRAQVESALVAGSNITITPGSSGATRTLTIASTGAVGGEIPSGFAEIASPVSTTSATLVDMPGVTTTVTLAATVPIIAVCSFEIETASGGASSTLGLVMSINGVDHQEHQHVLSGGSDRATSAITHCSDPLPAGTYTVKVRYRRVAGTATPGINNAALVAFAAQGAVGPTGPTGPAASGPITSSSLTMATARILGRSTAGTGAPEEFALGGSLSFTGSSLLYTDTIKLRISNTGETATVANNHTETTVPRACTVIGATWELAPTATGSTSSQAMLYARRSGVKTSLLSGNTSIASGASFTDATGTLTGTLTLAAGDTLGVDLLAVGTGSSGHIFSILVRYS